MSNEGLTGTRERIKVKDSLEIEHLRQGRLVRKEVLEDLITDAGTDLIADCVGKSASRPAVANRVAIGSKETTPTAGDTALGAELMRVTGTYAHTAGTNYWTVEGTFNITQSWNVRESGVLNADTGGSLLSRQVFTAYPVASGDTLVMKWRYTKT
jgi:hypothetical protein